MLNDLAWLIFAAQRMPRAKAVRRLRAARRQYELDLADAESQVVALHTAIAVIDEELANSRTVGNPD